MKKRTVPWNYKGLLWLLVGMLGGVVLGSADATTGTSNLTRVSCGVGLDYRSWNGAILQGPGGSLFGVRIWFVADGKLITGSAFYEQAERAGDYDPEGKYACLTTRDL
jgi:hypothetical protein